MFKVKDWKSLLTIVVIGVFSIIAGRQSMIAVRSGTWLSPLPTPRGVPRPTPPLPTPNPAIVEVATTVEIPILPTPTPTPVRDITPPVTECQLDGAPGAGGWYITPVTITLIATDHRSGVDFTAYRFDAETWWRYYTAPFSVTSPGNYTLEFYSVDELGNTEEILSTTFKIDLAPPESTVQLSGAWGNEMWYISPVTITLTATDDASGIDSTDYRLDGGGWLSYAAPFAVDTEGHRAMEFRSSDQAGHIEEVNAVAFKIDRSAPGTVFQLDGTLGEGGWYTSPVTITLTTEDPSAPDGTSASGQALSGVALTAYRLDEGEWMMYTTPFVVDVEGGDTLEFWSTDVAGNEEEIKSVGFRLDLAPPVVTITQPSAITYTLCSTFTVVYEAHDAASGLDIVTATLDGETITNGQTINTLFLTPGPHEIMVIAHDRASWQTIETHTFEIEATIEALVSAKHRLHEMGEIYGPGARRVVRWLDVILRVAMRARDRGLPHVAVKMLNVFIRCVQVQTDKHITPEAAAILIQGAEDVMERLLQ